MANHSATKKSIRQNEKRRKINISILSRVKTYEKHVLSSISEGNKEDSLKKLRDFQSVIFKAVNKNIIHKNKASRKTSRINKMLKQNFV